MPVLLALWRKYVKALPDWKERRYEGYLPVTVDGPVLAASAGGSSEQTLPLNRKADVGK